MGVTHETTQKARLEDVQEATLESTHEMTEESCTGVGEDNKGQLYGTLSVQTPR